MNIVERTKRFVKENKKELLLGAFIGTLTGVAYLVGECQGRRGFFKEFKEVTNIDLNKPHANGLAIMNAGKLGDNDFKTVMEYGLCEKSDDIMNTLLIIQKKES